MGAVVGALALVQGLVGLRTLSEPTLSPFEQWALAWLGAFGLMLNAALCSSADPVRWLGLAVAVIGTVTFYGLASVCMCRAFLSWRVWGLLMASLLVGGLHVSLYLLVVRSVVL